jgi:hypothetical protein
MCARNKKSDQAGTSLIELLTVLAMVGLSVGATTAILAPAEAPLETGAVLLEGFFTRARARAMATTSAYRVRAVDADSVVAQFAGSCSAATWTDEERMELELPRDVTLPDTSWTVCFTSRGAADANVLVALNHPRTGTKQVEVFTGGSARIVP